LLKGTQRSVLSLALVVLLSFSFLQVVPATAALPSPSNAQFSKPPPGFTLRGLAPDSLPVTVSLAIPLRNLGLLSSMVKAVSDPSSPSFRHFPSQQQLSAEFYPTVKFNEMMQYLSTTGLSVQYTALDSMIVLQGTVAQVRQAFGTDVRLYSNGTSSYYLSTSSSFRGAYLFASNATALVAKPAASLGRTSKANVTFTEGSFSAKLLQSVYNATGLYSQGADGSGKTIGILDFYGSPTITSDLQAFDKRFGFPDTTFNIIPIGPYAPNLGAYTGWSSEISLDVEVSHAMAPHATIDLYVGNGAISIADAISKIVSDNKVNTLSQSFTIPEWSYSSFGPGFFDFNALMPDQYYMLGALQGITFSGATGDTGGSGFSSGIEGQVGYPATSPYVTAVGGTQTYFAGNSFIQTGWSNPGWVPNFINYGGSGGGVSILEPKPWYQAAQPTPAALPAGRMNPDLSLQAGVDPATYIIDSGQVVGTGGTSESTPLLAGLITLLDSSINGSVGLINPFLYSLANNPATYTKAFTPITFGYNIPWVASKGYNLVTGWGSPNIGEMASLYKDAQRGSSLNVTVALSPGVDSSGLEFTPGSLLKVTATIKNGASAVTTGSFSATLATLTGNTQIPIAYNSTAGAWTGSYTMGSQSGFANVNVQGTSNGVSGAGFAPLFAGYLGTFYQPVPTYPWSTIGGLPVVVQSTDLDGNVAPAGPLSMEIDSYSITSNTYSTAMTVSLPSVLFGTENQIIINQSIPDGPASMVLKGSTYGYLPFISGIYLQTTYIYPAVVAEPGSVAPGQELTLIATPVAPINLYNIFSLETGNTVGSDVAVGSNVTAQLVNPSGTVVSTVNLAYQSCKEAVRVCGGGASILNGYLSVPSDSAPGLYTVLLRAQYGSDTLGETLNGSFYSQIWVSSGPIIPAVSIEPGFISASAALPPGVAPSTGGQLSLADLYEGEQAHVVARIAYPNGTAVKYGEYTALVYPETLQNEYTTLMHTEYANSELVQLTYDPAMQSWLGNVTLPGPASAGNIAPINANAFFYSGPYDAYVTGLSADGVPTTTALAAQSPFFIQPFTYVNGGTVSSLAQSSQLAFSGATITASGTLSGDLFLGTNTISGGTVTITGSQIEGNLVVNNANVTLVGVSGGNVTATGSTLTLKDSSVGSLSLTGSTVSLVDSSFQTVSPALPTISVTGLSQPISGQADLNVTVTGQQLTSSSLAAWVDGVNVPLTTTTTSAGLTAAVPINAASLNDGVHSLIVKATQADGLSSSFSGSFSTNAQSTALNSQLQQANANINSLSSQLKQANGATANLNSQLQQANANINFLSSQLKQANGATANLFDISYGLAAVAIIALVLGVVAFRRKPSAA
jgi:subtilase family serine protease